MPGPPQLSDEERRRALAKAAEARRVRADVKEQLKTGALGLVDLLAAGDTPEDELVKAATTLTEALRRLV